MPLALLSMKIKDVSRSYKEAKMTLDVGKIFYSERSVVAYSNLGIGRLIYQLPIPLCKMFIREIFDGKSPDDFDEETLTTINKFFEKQPECFGNVETAVYSQKYTCISSGQAAEKVQGLI